MNFGPDCRTAIIIDPRTDKRTIVFNWSQDSLFFSNSDKNQKDAFAYNNLVMLYVLQEKQLSKLDEIAMYIERNGDSTRFNLFCSVVDAKMRRHRFTVDEKMQMLKDLSAYTLDHSSVSDWDNPLKNIFRITVQTPGFLFDENDLSTMVTALRSIIEDFVLLSDRKNYSRYQVICMDKDNERKKSIFLVPDSKKTTL